MNIFEERHGYVTHEVSPHNAMHTVVLKNHAGCIVDKIRCDTASQARDYVRAFRKIARTGGNHQGAMFLDRNGGRA